MAATVPPAGLDRTDAFRIGVEQRFPLDLTSANPTVWDAYETALIEAWDPEDDVLWDGFDPGDIGAREAAALVWSHRAWVEYPAIAESEAVLIRACLERGIDIDFKYCLSMRASERARSTDLCHLVASRLSAYSPAPNDSAVARLLDAELVRRVLHESSDFDAYVAAHLAAQATIDLRSWERAGDNCTGALNKLVGLVCRDKARMLEVAWLHLAERLDGAEPQQLAAVVSAVEYTATAEELAGRTVPALLGAGPERDRLVAAHETAAAARLGGVSVADQLTVVGASFDELTERFARIGITVAFDAVDQR